MSAFTKQASKDLRENDVVRLVSCGPCATRGNAFGIIFRFVCPSCIEIETENDRARLNVCLDVEGEDILRRLLNFRHKERKARKHAETTQPHRHP